MKRYYSLKLTEYVPSKLVVYAENYKDAIEQLHKVLNSFYSMPKFEKEQNLNEQET